MQIMTKENDSNTGKVAFSVPELAAALGVCVKSAYELANSEGFPSFRLGRRLLIPTDALREWLKRQTE